MVKLILIISISVVILAAVFIFLNYRVNRWRKTRKPGDLCRFHIGEEKVDGQLIHRYSGGMWFIMYGDNEFTFRHESDIFP